MKFSTTLSLALAPVVLAKAVRNSYPVKRVPEKHRNGGGNGLRFGNGISGFGITDTTRAEVVIIWVNGGGGAQTTTVNQQVTVTQTVVVPGATGGAPPPVAAPPPAVAAPGTPTPPEAPNQVVAPGGVPTHSVTVGGPAGLVFTPPEIKANVGDMVVFTFLSQNHTATQSAFNTPCDPLAGGMDSGYMANPNNTITPAPQVAMQVMVSEPLWFFCAQGPHCGKGMTFSINPTAEKTQAMFQAMAIQQKGNGAPSAIVGGAPAAPPAAPAAPASPPADTTGAAPSATPDAPQQLQPLPGNSNNATPGAPGSVVPGVGTVNPDGSCSCAVQCGAGSFPAIESQGIGAFGGLPGALPQNMVSA